MKKNILFLFLSIVSYNTIRSQISLPYYQNFDSVSCFGWTHYALLGNDDWQRGIPSGQYLNVANSAPNVWGTNLSGSTTDNSIMELETPDFDLSDLTKTFLLSFAHEFKTFSYHGGNIQYSTDMGATWVLLNGTSSEKQNWYNNTSCPGLNGQPTWSNNYYSSFQFASHSLTFLQGQLHVRFRFQYGGSTNSQDGWQIDNFSLVENAPNVLAIQGQTYNASKYFSTFNIVTTLIYNGLLPPSFSNITNYYFSKDNVLDSGDSLLGSKSQTISSTISNWSRTFNMVPNLYAGDYYIFFKHDFSNNLSELDEIDNTNYCILHIDSTFTIPELKEDLEGITDFWKAYGNPLNWVKGFSNIHQIEGVHSGTNSWFIKGFGAPQYLESPYLDFTSANNNVFCLWYKTSDSEIVGYDTTKIEFSKANSSTAYLSSSAFPLSRIDGWDCHCVNLSYLNGCNNGKIRISALSNQYLSNVDDFYIGQPKPDLSIENKNDLTTPQNFTSDTISYMLFNSGLLTSGASISKFYWSADSLWDSGDQLIASVNESSLHDTSYRYEKISYLKPTLAPGTYFIIYKLDDNGVIDEMREENNIGFFKLKQEASIPVPYFNDFETQVDGWWHNASIGIDEWQWGAPSGTILHAPFSGTKAFHTTSGGGLSAMSREHLYTPAFDLTTISNPVLEFDMITDGLINLSYSVNGGATWIILDTTSFSYNKWYDNQINNSNYSALLFAGTESCFRTFPFYFDSIQKDWDSPFIIDIGFLSVYKNVQFRFNIGNGNPSTPIEGAVIDNFGIREKFIDIKVLYKKALMISSLNQKVKFFMEIKNHGNYISNPLFVKFYVSSDTIIDNSDFYLGQDSLMAISPNNIKYINEIFNGPPDLSVYSFLLYKLDATDTNVESDEVNNVSNWPLALDSVSVYPYIMDFNDKSINGWNHYLFDHVGDHIDRWRFRNIALPGYHYQTQVQTGQVYTEDIPSFYYISQVPFMYLESPSFDFTLFDSVKLTFDLMVLGHTNFGTDGANMQYSLDGGNSWSLLGNVYSDAYRWYNNSNLVNVNGQPGWTHLVVPGQLLDSVYFNLSFLRGEKDVVFRYQFRSNSQPAGVMSPYGMRLDNFKIDAFQDDYNANDSLVPVNVNISVPNVNLNYSITNLGNGNGRASNTDFYWSTDSVFDISDSLLVTVPETNINSGNTLNTMASITYPTTLTLSTYYVFYFTDADSNLVEVNEHNNVGSFKLSFAPYVNYHSNNLLDTIHALVLQPTFNINYSITNFGTLNGNPTTTKFYWSTDNSFDIGDANIQTTSETAIAFGNTINAALSVSYPSPVTQINYYLFYRSDANNSISELDETDNVGSFAVVFNYVNSISSSLDNELVAFVNNNSLFIQSSNADNGTKYTVRFINSIGEIISNSEICLNEGINKFDLPNNTAPGLYLVSLENEQRRLCWKIVIQK